MSEISTLSAESLVKQFVPYWETQNRLYFSDKKTEPLVISYKWDASLAIWIGEFEKENKDKKKARLAHNIALAYECKGDIDEAVKWSDKALSLSSSEKINDIKTQIEYYNVLLKQRVIALQKLAIQIGSPDDVLKSE